VISWGEETSGSGPGIELHDFAPPALAISGLAAAHAPTNDLGDYWQAFVLDVGAVNSAVWGGVEDAFGSAGAAVEGAFADLASDLEAWGSALSDVTGVGWIDDFTAVIGGGITAAGEFVGGAIASVPAMVEGAVDYVSNMTVDDMLDAGQLGLDVIGMVPGAGIVADLANVAISAARGNWVDVGLSLAAAVPGAGLAAGGAKIGKKVIGAGKAILNNAHLKCFVTRGCFEAGTTVYLESSKALESTCSTSNTPGIHSSELAIVEASPCIKVPVESVAIGSRVTTQNPVRADFDFTLPEPNQFEWSLLYLQSERADGGIVDIELLRPMSLIKDLGLEAGAYMEFDVDELEIRSRALVKSIEPCPPISEGVGSVVTARFVTRFVDELVTITFDDGTQLSGTDIHPIWLPRRGEWIGLGELSPDDYVLADGGNMLAVRSIVSRVHRQPVYNIEVHGEHVYQAGEAGALVHNGDNYSAMLRGWKVAVPKALKNLGNKLHGHHIVMKGAWKHSKEIRSAVRASRGILRRAGIRSINHRSNLAWARNWDHSIEYAKSVLARLRDAERLAGGDSAKLKMEVINALNDIAAKLATGNKYRYPH